VIAAKGGLERLRAVRTLIVKSREQSIGPNNETTSADVTTYLEYPNHVRVEVAAPQGMFVRGYDGGRGWINEPRGTQDVPEAMLQELKNGLRRDTIAALVAAADGTVRARLLPDVKDPDGRLHHALELSAPDLDPMVMYVDPATSLVTKQTYVAGGMGRAVVEELPTDYRAIDGVQIAHTMIVRVGGRQVLERRITDIRINAPIAPTLFKRPS
jgi:hypothetical protein